MALNWAMLSPERSPIPLPNEQTITSIDSGAELLLIIPNVPPSGSMTSGGSGSSRTMKETGRIWLTDQRLVFVSDTKGQQPSFDSLSVLLTSIQSTKFEQPYFGANYLVIEIKPTADGGLTEGTKAEVRLKDKGLFSFVSVLEKTRERAIYMKRQSALDDDETLPTYPSTPDAGPSGSVEMPADNPPAYDG
ncbi:hypothetical protein GLOTRDRAFT_109461 [Gloeophyllum trabeum ATCC 11539]|uniref:GRAM domain-containing protein n=1 Tax=Gloeophyllum trabeum (strain ATCC 11539 / FP-39264 / Madison 617) TaxID=670483 RepID=S7QI97_GLOTA|nr:uncharacterized protein GLOTRDRAFT_109461 [Gloeophyllum trabeum ATCC 11539]EPQ58917.1 hypothetical protein GLOTRDRAFT_109461 [Gloeophyllum trabeum ATCC 11539]